MLVNFDSYLILLLNCLYFNRFKRFRLLVAFYRGESVCCALIDLLRVRTIVKRLSGLAY